MYRFLGVLVFLVMLCNNGYAQQWQCGFSGSLEEMVWKNMMDGMTKDDQINVVKKLPGEPKDHIRFRMIVEDVYSKDPEIVGLLKRPINEVPVVLNKRGRKICENLLQ